MTTTEFALVGNEDTRLWELDMFYQNTLSARNALDVAIGKIVADLKKQSADIWKNPQWANNRIESYVHELGARSTLELVLSSTMMFGELKTWFLSERFARAVLNRAQARYMTALETYARSTAPLFHEVADAFIKQEQIPGFDVEVMRGQLTQL